MLKYPETRRLMQCSPHQHALTRYATSSLPETMSTPSPLLSPDEFLAHVKSLGLDAIVTPILHYKNRPLPSLPGGRYDENATQEWCERMDTLLVRVIRSQYPSLTSGPQG